MTSRAQEERAKVTASLLKGDTRSFQKKIAELSADLTPAEIVSRTRDAAQWLEANSDFISKMPTVIAKAELSDEVRSRLVYVLQKLGSESAQNALLTIVEDPVQSESTRRAALGAFAFIPISSATEDVLWQIRRGERVVRSQVFQEMATLALGGAARAWEQLDRVRTDTLALQLLAQLKESTQKNDTRDVETILMALGNSGALVARDTFEQYLTSGVDSVRKAVATALQSFEKEPNLERIADTILVEENPGVREELATVLLQHNVTEYTFAAAAQLFVEEDDKATRLLLARYLAKAVASFPQQRAHIRALLRVETDPLVAEALGTRVNPQLQ
jgi:HEAT repeat protein